jgi:hypothetical protein
MKIESPHLIAVPAETAYTLETVLSPRTFADLPRDVATFAGNLATTAHLGPRLARLIRRPGIADTAPDARRLEIELEPRTAFTVQLAARQHGTTPEAIIRAALHLRALAAASVNRKKQRDARSRGEALPDPGTCFAYSIQVSDYHLEGMELAALASTAGGGNADGWATRILAASRLPKKPARQCSFPDRPTGHVVTVTLPRQRLDQLDAIAYRDGRPLRKWIHAALVAASAKYRATLDRQAGARPSPDIEPAPCQSLPENVLPFFTGPFRRP